MEMAELNAMDERIKTVQAHSQDDEGKEEKAVEAKAEKKARAKKKEEGVRPDEDRVLPEA